MPSPRIDIESVTRSALIAAHDGNVADAAATMRIKPSTLYGWPDLPNYRFQCAIVTACDAVGKGAALRRAVSDSAQPKAA